MIAEQTVSMFMDNIFKNYGKFLEKELNEPIKLIKIYIYIIILFKKRRIYIKI